MKWNEQPINPALQPLCRYFVLSPSKLAYYDRIRLLYVYRSLTARHGDDMDTMLLEIDGLRRGMRVRSRRRSLRHVFEYCQLESMASADRLAPVEMHPPPDRIIPNYY